MNTNTPTFSWSIRPIRMAGVGRIITFYLYTKRPGEHAEVAQGMGSKTDCRAIVAQLKAGARAFKV